MDFSNGFYSPHHKRSEEDSSMQLEAHLMSHLKFEKSFEELKSGSFSL